VGTLETVTIDAGGPARDFPASTLRAYLKQIDVACLEQELRSELARCFPYFDHEPGRSMDQLAASLGLSGHNVRWLIMANGVYDTREGRYRRYAGGRDLPPARYYAVCEDESGNDGGTLCFELLS